MKILILGSNGMLGHRLMLDLNKDHQVWGTLRKLNHSQFHLPNISSDQFIGLSDCLNEQELENCLKVVRPDVVINCVGIIKQVAEGKQYIPSISINSLFPHLLAKLCDKHKARLIHFSTDCVFDGKKGNYSENDIPNSTDLYGRSKLLGEVDYLPQALTFRTSIIGRELRPKGSLVEWFLSQKGKSVHGYANAIYTGFPTHTLANIIKDYVLPNTKLSGVYHLSSEPISKLELLQMLNEAFDCNTNIVEEYEFKMDRSLDSFRFRKLTGFKPRPWPDMVEDLLIDSDWYAAVQKEGI